ncbi:alpha/beta hydrolase family protein [Accumulibacter sp.]|uniref:alpha/beta hydrolase family protein n=1 Tax=Accumulibacter sp. TaxID=2053492 RepID=UPI0035AEBE37
MAKIEGGGLNAYVREARHGIASCAVPRGRRCLSAALSVNAAHRLRSPLLLLQGLEDTVVPPKQAELTYSAARDAGAYVRCLMIEGDGHGFVARRQSAAYWKPNGVSWRRGCMNERTHALRQPNMRSVRNDPHQ